MGSGSTTGKPVVVKYMCRRGEGGHDDQDAKGLNKFPFEKSFEILGYILNLAGKSHGSLEERMQKANNGKDDLKHCSEHSYRKSLPKACGELWDGYVTKGRMQLQSPQTSL